MPKVSVVIPNYNHARFLKQRIDTVLNQTFQDFEVILLDDCSTDNSIEIIESYRNHPKVSHIEYNKVNSGSVFKQWIKGIYLAKGEYLWIAESDDYADESFLEVTVSKMDEFCYGFVFVKSIKVNSINIPLYENKSRLSLFNKLKEHNGIIDYTNAFTFFIKNTLIHNASSVLFRKMDLLNIELNILSNYKNVGDIFSYLSIICKKPIVFIDKNLNYSRIHQNNTTNSNIKSGVIYLEKIVLLEYFSYNKINLEKHRDAINQYVKNLIVPALDFGYNKELITLLKKLHKQKLLNTRIYLLNKAFIIIYKNLIKKVNSHKLRKIFKKILSKQ